MNLLTHLLLVLITTAATCDRIIQTTNGPIRGMIVESGKVEAFLGIPYAEPPVGRLRFAKPVSKSSGEAVYHANQLPPPCIQAKFGPAYFAPNISNMSEDCLYLNLWVPQSQDKSERKTILIFIHGGGFMVGSSNMKVYDGALLAEYGDIIVATINYRVGGLGFFTGKYFFSTYKNIRQYFSYLYGASRYNSMRTHSIFFHWQAKCEEQ